MISLTATIRSSPNRFRRARPSRSVRLRVPRGRVPRAEECPRFANLLGIDLRDLPLSFLVLDRRPVLRLPQGAARVIGHPRIYKAHALLLGCDASGVRERKLTQRALPEEFRRWKKGKGDVLQIWRCDGDEIAESEAL